METKWFTDKLIVVRDPTETDNPTSDNYAACPDCLGFFMRKTSTAQTRLPGSYKYSNKDGNNKNIKAAIFALMLEIKANHNTPFQEFLYNNLRNDPVAELVRNDPLIKYVGEYYFNKRKSDKGYNQIRNRMRVLAKLVLQLECSYLIELFRTDMWSKVKEAVSKNFAKSYQVKMGSILKTAAAFLQNQAFVWGKKEISQRTKQFQKNIDTEWAQISAPAKYEYVGTIQKLLGQIFTRSTNHWQNLKKKCCCREKETWWNFVWSSYFVWNSHFQSFFIRSDRSHAHLLCLT